MKRLRIERIQVFEVDVEDEEVPDRGPFRGPILGEWIARGREVFYRRSYRVHSIEQGPHVRPRSST